MALIDDPSFKKWVQVYAEDEEKFTKDFKNAFEKLLIWESQAALVCLMLFLTLLEVVFWLVWVLLLPSLCLRVNKVLKNCTSFSLPQLNSLESPCFYTGFISCCKDFL